MARQSKEMDASLHQLSSSFILDSDLAATAFSALTYLVECDGALSFLRHFLLKNVHVRAHFDELAGFLVAGALHSKRGIGLEVEQQQRLHGD